METTYVCSNWNEKKRTIPWFLWIAFYDQFFYKASFFPIKKGVLKVLCHLFQGIIFLFIIFFSKCAFWEKCFYKNFEFFMEIFYLLYTSIDNFSHHFVPCSQFIYFAIHRKNSETLQKIQKNSKQVLKFKILSILSNFVWKLFFFFLMNFKFRFN